MWSEGVVSLLSNRTQIMNNEEIKNMIRILGLQYGKKYSTTSELNTLRYGRIMVMADQDQDGSHIKGLIINFIHHNWPDLLRHGFIVEFITPIVKVSVPMMAAQHFSSSLLGHKRTAAACIL